MIFLLDLLLLSPMHESYTHFYLLLLHRGMDLCQSYAELKSQIFKQGIQQPSPDISDCVL